MNLFFEKQHKKRQADIEDGLYLKQPELDPNASFMVSFRNTGGYSLAAVHTGMKFDEKPFENTGKYLHENAPKQYNEAKIAKEKQNYIKKYIDTSGANLDASQFKKSITEYLSIKNLKTNPPQNNQPIYQEFETLAGYPFPEELKTIFTIHNDIENPGFLSAENVLIEWKNWKIIYDDPNWMLTELKGNNHPDGRKTLRNIHQSVLGAFFKYWRREFYSHRLCTGQQRYFWANNCFWRR